MKISNRGKKLFQKVVGAGALISCVAMIAVDAIVHKDITTMSMSGGLLAGIGSAVLAAGLSNEKSSEQCLEQ